MSGRGLVDSSNEGEPGGVAVDACQVAVYAELGEVAVRVAEDGVHAAVNR